MDKTDIHDGEPNWPAFYESLSWHGPAALEGVDDVERDYIAQEARETDSFWSVAMQDALVDGWTCPESAVASAAAQWLVNIRTHVLEDLVAVDCAQRRQLAASLSLDLSNHEFFEHLMCAATSR